MDDAEAARRAALEEWQQPSGGHSRNGGNDRGHTVHVERGSASSRTPKQNGGICPQTLYSNWTRRPRRASRLSLKRRTTPLQRHEHAEAERRATAERDSAARRAREAICERLEAAHAEQALEEIEKARGEWEGLPGPSTQELEDEQTRATVRGGVPARRRSGTETIRCGRRSTRVSTGCQRRPSGCRPDRNPTRRRGTRCARNGRRCRRRPTGSIRQCPSGSPPQTHACVSARKNGARRPSGRCASRSSASSS